jgi:hypothetical protein
VAVSVQCDAVGASDHVTAAVCQHRRLPCVYNVGYKLEIRPEQIPTRTVHIYMCIAGYHIIICWSHAASVTPFVP